MEVAKEGDEGRDGRWERRGTPLFERRRTSFEAVAQAYAAFRPDYPGDAVAWLVDVEPAAGRRVLDLGAGTGKLTARLRDLGHEVVAVDPSAGMLAELRAAVPGVETREGSAEALPLPDASFDAVTVAQAWHWFDAGRAAAECARVLRPGGTLGIAWHVRDERVPWVEELSLLVGRPGDFASSDWGAPLELPAPFGPVQRRLFGYEQRLTPQGLRALAGSWSYVALRDDRDAVLDAVEELGRRVAGPDGTLVLPHRTRCFRAVR